MKYRKKPVVIEAMRFTIEDENRVLSWITCNHYPSEDKNRNHTIVIQTLEGDMTASLGDWVIRGVKGEFYPCKNDIFIATYELAEDGD